MSNSARLRAQALFAASQKKDNKALNQKENTQRQKAEQIASLRARGLAGVASDKEAIPNAPVKNWKPWRSPHGH